MRFNQLINALTLPEKIAMIHGDGLFKTGAVERFSIPALTMSDGPMGVRQDFHNGHWMPLGLSNDYVTYFPSNLALAATWNPDLAYDFGKDLGEESRARNKDVILAPGINIIRSPLCGRNFEYMSEDPHLIEEMAVPIIEGIQEEDVAACVKHFAVNNQETRRMNVDVDVDERALHELYLPGFKAAVEKAKTRTIMTAYNKLYGDYCSESYYLLTEILRNDWRFDGLLISDWGAIHHTEKAYTASMDIEMSVTDDFDFYHMALPLKKAIERGELHPEELDAKINRILCLMETLHMLNDVPENLLPDDLKGVSVDTAIKRSLGAYNTMAHQEGTLKTARESVVLLKNDNHLLPIDPTAYTDIAVIGQNANAIHSNGGGSAEIKSLYEISPLLGMQMVVGGNTTFHYAPGYTSGDEGTLNQISFLRDQALRVAGACDLVIFVGGLNHDHDLEGQDRKDLALPYEQEALILALHAVNPNLVVVNVSGSPVDLTAISKDVPAVVQTWYNGMNGGLALAEVLFGNVNPSGKLPVSFPKTLSDVSAHSIGNFPGDDTVHYTEGIFVGYRHHITHNIPALYPFGHGLSYTTFSYENPRVNSSSFNSEDEDSAIEVSFTLTNTGDRFGMETVQLYVQDVESELPRPTVELKGFRKVALEAGETQTVTFNLPPRAFRYYNPDKKTWVFEPGAFKLHIGASSTDLLLTETVTL